MELNEPDAVYSTQNYDFNDGTNEIIRCAIEVHKTLGAGFREIVYQRALALEFDRSRVSYDREVKMPIITKVNKLIPAALIL